MAPETAPPWELHQCEASFSHLFLTVRIEHVCSWQDARFFVPGISLIGVGACHGIPHYVHTYHITKPLIVTDKGIVNTGILKIITDILDGDNIPYSIYDKTVPNPTDENVTEGVAQYKADGCDGLISIGGGSSHDCCKGIGSCFPTAARFISMKACKVTTAAALHRHQHDGGHRFGTDALLRDHR